MIYSQQQINTVIERAKSNSFAKMMSFGESLTLGVATPPNLFLQSNLIFFASSDYATLAQKNTLVQLIGKYRMDSNSPDNYVSSNYMVAGYVQ